jgi:hypothetical protein
MTNDDFKQITDKLLDDCMLVMHATKGVDYATTDDRLANFNEQAAQYGLTPAQIWMVYAGKHWDAVVRAIKKNPTHPQKKGEPLRENFKDLIVYALIGYAISVQADKEHDGGTRQPDNRESPSLVLPS